MKIYKAVSAVLLIFALTFAIIAVPKTVYAEEERIPMVIIYAQVPDNWTVPGIWAWGPRGNAFQDWPGGIMTPDPNNPGWYFAHLPADKTGAIINDHFASEQTDDFEFNGEPIWITVNSPGDGFEVTTEQQTVGDFPPFYPLITIYAHTPEGWDSPSIWAWGPRGNAFENWPGGSMSADLENPGWYFAQIPSDSTGALINANDGSVQTSDFEFTGESLWITISDDGEEVVFEVSDTKLTEGNIRGAMIDVTADPAEPPGTADFSDIDTITIFANIPDAWQEAGLWAWNENDGLGNVFGAWPGPRFEQMDGIWHTMEVPDWVDSIIINALGGGVQTVDILVEKGKDVYIAITDAEGGFHLEYESFDPNNIGQVEAAPLPTLAPPVVIQAGTTPAPTVASNDSATNTAVIIIIVVVAVVVIAGVAFIIVKKKKEA